MGGSILKMRGTYFSNSAPDRKHTSGDYSVGDKVYSVGDKVFKLVTNRSVTKVNGRWTRRVIR